MYTIRRTQALDRSFESRRAGSFIENKAWTGADTLLAEATTRGERMPIVFAAAEGDVGAGLTYWAVLEQLDVDPGDRAFGRKPRTRYSFVELTRLPSGRHLTDLTKKSDGKSLSESYIRPYALCRTPRFLQAEDPH